LSGNIQFIMRSSILLGLVAAVAAAPSRRQEGQEAQRAAAVKEAFEFAWSGYYQYVLGRIIQSNLKAD
jgi:hypothetical protein